MVAVYDLLVCFLLVSVIVVSSIPLWGVRRSPCLPVPSDDDSGCPPGARSTANPLVFGPILWPALHIIAAQYPSKGRGSEKAPPVYQRHAKQFIEALPFMLPCGDCGMHLLEFLGTKDLNQVVRTKADLIKFFVEAQNNVTRHINQVHQKGRSWPARPLLTVAEAKAKYSCSKGCVRDPRIWAGESLWHHLDKNTIGL